MERVLLRLLMAVAALLYAATPTLAATPQRIVAVGDLHGDYAAWTAIASDAGLIDKAGRWTGGDTILVQLGDIADRGPDTLKIITSLRTLQKDAPKAGGKVIVLTGNHEAMNVVGDLRYVVPGEYAAFATRRSAAVRDRFYSANRQRLEKEAHATDPSLSPAAVRDRFYAVTPLGWVEHREAWSPSGDIGRWVASNPAIVRIGDTLFVHGGISAETARAGIDKANDAVAAALARGDGSQQSTLYDPLGPLWYRGLVAKDPDAIAARGVKGSPVTAESELRTVLAATGAKHIVVAHTPTLAGIQVLYDGKLVRVDTGNAAYYKGQPSWLEIKGEAFIPHKVERSGS